MHILKAIREDMFVPIHIEGWPFIGLCAVFATILGIIWSPFLYIAIPVTLWCVYFFRHPPRVTPADPLAIIAPADGRILSMGEAELPPELSSVLSHPLGRWRRISIFMNVFDVHINRSPYAGVIAAKKHIAGAFVNASLDKASLKNERLMLVIDTGHAKIPQIGCVQIAGLVARRISCHVAPGDHVRTGQTYGLIRFGSRVDLWLPYSIKPLIHPGQTSIAGETVLARMPAPAPQKVKGKK